MEARRELLQQNGRATNLGTRVKKNVNGGVLSFLVQRPDHEEIIAGCCYYGNRRSRDNIGRWRESGKLNQRGRAERDEFFFYFSFFFKKYLRNEPEQLFF
jgi:hypothetical protein